MSTLDWTQLQGIAGLGRLPNMPDRCAETGMKVAPINTQYESDIKNRLDDAAMELQNAQLEIESHLTALQSILNPQAVILSRDLIQALGQLERTALQVQAAEDDIGEREANLLQRFPNMRCYYAGKVKGGNLYQTSLPSVQAVEDLVARSLASLELRSLRQAVGQMQAAEAGRVAQLEAREQAAISQQHQQQLAAEEAIRRQEAMAQEARARESASEDQRQLAIEREIRLAEIQAEAARADAQAKWEVEKQKLELEREKQQRMIAAEEQQAAAAQQAAWTAQPPGAAPVTPEWVQELLTSIAAMTGPASARVTMPPQDAFAYDPHGRPVDMFGRVIRPQAPMALPMPIQQPPPPSYYQPIQPTGVMPGFPQLAVQAPPQPLPVAMPGSPFQLQTFVPSGAEMFGLGSIDPYAAGQPAAALMIQARALRSSALSVRQADEGSYIKMNAEADLLEQKAKVIAAEQRAGASPTEATQTAEQAVPTPGSGGILSSISAFVRDLAPIGERAYRLHEGLPTEGAVVVKKQATWTQYVLPGALVVGGVLVARKVFGKKKRRRR